ncbi:unnamed protein product [Rhizophagus irregularis]|nr:unnamed protein product [Rhizophagus irregularis]CAB4443606.1 unnamed protein product [Rhizophagus irregularis]
MIRTDQITTARSFSIFTPFVVNSTRKVKIIFKYMYAENLETECQETSLLRNQLCIFFLTVLEFEENIAGREKSEGGWESEAEDLCDKKPKY